MAFCAGGDLYAISYSVNSPHKNKIEQLTHAKVLDGLPSVLLSPQQDGVRTSGRTQCQLVQSQGLTTSVQDALPCRPCETQSSDGELGHLGQTDVIGDSSDNDDDF